MGRHQQIENFIAIGGCEMLAEILFLQAILDSLFPLYNFVDVALSKSLFAGVVFLILRKKDSFVGKKTLIINMIEDRLYYIYTIMVLYILTLRKLFSYNL